MPGFFRMKKPPTPNVEGSLWIDQILPFSARFDTVT